MSQYAELVKALRCCDKYALCNDCPIFETCDGDVDKAMAIAADAIEALQAEVKDAFNEGYNAGYTAGIGYCSFKRAKMEVQDG